MKMYHDLLRLVIAEGEPHEDRTGVGTTSLFGAQVRHRMRDGFPLLTTRRINFRTARDELAWILRGETNTKTLGSRIWDQWADADGELGPTYGKCWRDFEGVDQVQVLLDDVRATPESRRLIVTAWHPTWARETKVPPCPMLWQFKVHRASREMSLQVYWRSCDIFLGLPFDMAEAALMLHLVCAETSYRPRDLVMTFGDLHLYSNHAVQALQLLARKPLKLPALTVSMTRGDLKEFACELAGYEPLPAIRAEVAV